MYALWIHQSLPYPEHLLGVTDPGQAAWPLGLQYHRFLNLTS